MRESTGGTRERIQAVALELFTEQGYEKTSLREIAERLNVTKAALYYHFKSKDDIVASFVEDRLDQMDALIAWAEYAAGDAGHPPRADLPLRRHDVRRRHAIGDALLRAEPDGAQEPRRRPADARPDDAAGRRALPGRRLPRAQLRAALSLFAVHTSWFAVRAPDITDEERRQLALEVADELLAAIGAEPDASATPATSGSTRG